MTSDSAVTLATPVTVPTPLKIAEPNGLTAMTRRPVSKRTDPTRCRIRRLIRFVMP
jgi:hypothetical protein